MYPVETVVDIAVILDDYVKIGFLYSVVTFLILFFLVWGIGYLIELFKKISR
jgi:hypothetical protein